MTPPVFVLVRPQMGENIGAAARAMLNFSLDRMRIVDPRDGWPNPRAVALASGAASRVLDRAGVFPTLPEALSDCAYVFATSARGRELTKPVVTPHEAMAEARALSKAGRQVAVLFGPERSGLENHDLSIANALISVPVNPEFPSLNLAQAVLLCAYEWIQNATDTGEAALAPALAAMAAVERASQVQVERLSAHFEERLDEAGYFFPAERGPSMRLNLRNLWSRMPLTGSDVQTLHGALRQLVRRRDGGGGGSAS